MASNIFNYLVANNNSHDEYIFEPKNNSHLQFSLNNISFPIYFFTFLVLYCKCEYLLSKNNYLQPTNYFILTLLYS